MQKSMITVRSFHSTVWMPSRIKRRHTHKPFWHIKKMNKVPNEPLTKSNLDFLDSVKQTTFLPKSDEEASPLKTEFAPIEKGKWKEKETIRCGVLARKIGVSPLWTKNGTSLLCTMLHVEDTHVVRYSSPEEYSESIVGEKLLRPEVDRDTHSSRYAALTVGALTGDPSKVTKGYCNLFTDSGIAPKKKIARFLVTKNALVQPGTQLFASHFQVGQYVDIRGISIRKGFQGVMKRWGFQGMPSDARGVTKSHRRPGSIGSGCDKSRVWPGQKLPGDVGGNRVTSIGLQILRINHRFGVIYVQGPGIPGNNGDFVQIFDSRHPEKLFKEAPRFFPTSTFEDNENLPEEEYADHIHPFHEESIVF